ncbi:MAG: nucleotidyltransferase domain-containing protein [Methanosarcinales archaeon]
MKALEEFVNKALEKYGDKIEKMILFGSYARGDYNKDSDIDILVIWKDRKIEGWNALENIAVDLLLKFDVLISLKIVSPSEFEIMRRLEAPFLKNIQKEGVLIG